jgi:lipoic acid synthetase
MTVPVPIQLIRGRHRRPDTLPRDKKPPWLRVRAPGSPDYLQLKRLMRNLSLTTVCEEANCPNIGECWSHGTATFMILGDICTRSCGYCNVVHGTPQAIDAQEPTRVAKAVRTLGLQHVVITSVDRDDIDDGGSGIFASTIETIRKQSPQCRIEVLIPDFSGRTNDLHTVLNAGPNILNHNIETVERLYRVARPGGRYKRALGLLKTAGDYRPTIPTKSGVMVGLGESLDELFRTMSDLREVDCNILTIGQYLRPSLAHLPVVKYYHPDEFTMLQERASALGFRHVESGPLVRSSYHAHEQANAAELSSTSCSA